MLLCGPCPPHLFVVVVVGAGLGEEIGEKKLSQDLSGLSILKVEAVYIAKKDCYSFDNLYSFDIL